MLFRGAPFILLSLLGSALAMPTVASGNDVDLPARRDNDELVIEKRVRYC